MAKMVNPELEAVRFENEDVIAASVYAYRRYSGSETTGGYEVYGPNFDSSVIYPDAAAAAAAIAAYYSSNGTPDVDAVAQIANQLNGMNEGSQNAISNPNASGN